MSMRDEWDEGIYQEAAAYYSPSPRPSPWEGEGVKGGKVCSVVINPCTLRFALPSQGEG